MTRRERERWAGVSKGQTRARTGIVVRFRILGPLEVWTGQGWGGIGASKWRALLAALLLNPGQAVSTDRLIAELWGDAPPDRAPNLVSVYVFRLRRVLGDPEGRVLVRRAPGYQLLLEAGDTDAGRFETLVSQGRRALAAGDPQRAAGELAEALGLWRGRALADVPPTPLISAEAGRLEESRLAALELRIEADIGVGLHAQLVPELRRLLSDHPLREGLWGLLIRALDAAGRHAEALAAYGEARAVISDELGVDPGPELQRLYQAMLAADRIPERRAAEPAPGAVAGAPDGSQTGSGAAFPPPSRPAPAQLPADVADFTGRDRHVGRLRDLMSRSRMPDNPAVTVAVVAGAGGLGKTTFAVHAAHLLRPGFPDGQLYVSLRGGSEQPVPPDEVLARFLRDLGVDGTRVPVDTEERAAMYRTRLAGRQMLIVLDDARDAAQVRPLLPGTGSCAVIVTSRHRLSDLAGSRLVDLDVLDEAEAAELFTRIVGAERVDAEPGPVRDVLAVCAGLPLAIRIAGARLSARRTWSVARLADRLADQRRRMDELASGDMALRATFGVSFDALPRPAGGGRGPAGVFRMLGIWQGPSISLPAAAALVGGPEDAVEEALEVLVDANLLDSPGPDRYRLHDLLRAYAAELAEADEAAAAIEEAVRRLLDWYLRTTDAAAGVVAPYLDGVPLEEEKPGCEPLAFATAEQALGWCETERANLVAATRQAAAHGLHDIAWKLPAAMRVLLDRLGYRAEWLTTHRIALTSARACADRAGEAWVLANLGTVLGQQRGQDAVGYFEQAQAIYREIGDQRREAQVASALAFTYLVLGRHEEAVAALLAALALQREAGRRYGEGVALCNLGEAYLELGRHDEAIDASQQALAIAREVGSDRDQGYALYNLGRAHLDLGRLDEAGEELEQALAIHRAAGDRHGEARDLWRIGTARARAGRPAEARQAWTLARSLLEGLGEDAESAEISEDLDGLDNGR